MHQRSMSARTVDNLATNDSSARGLLPPATVIRAPPVSIRALRVPGIGGIARRARHRRSPPALEIAPSTPPPPRPPVPPLVKVGTAHGSDGVRHHTLAQAHPSRVRTLVCSVHDGTALEVHYRPGAHYEHCAAHCELVHLRRDNAPITVVPALQGTAKACLPQRIEITVGRVNLVWPLRHT